MRVRTPRVFEPGLGRLVGSVLLVLGIALMHHVVVTTCSSAIGGQAHGHAVQMDSTTAPALDGISQGALPEPAPAAALCLAVMLVGWFLAPVVREWRRRRDADASEPTRRARVSGAPPHPPDLAVLSVCRT